MIKDITNIFINSRISLLNKSGEFSGVDYQTSPPTITAGKIFSIYIETPPIIIKNRANLKVANICHSGTGHEDKIITFKLDGIMTDNNKYISNDGGIPTIIATTFNNTRNLYEENDIPLVRQTINSIRLVVSDDLSNPFAGIDNTINFCISLKIEEYINE
jgi:hypothetical protein